jgi:hypothetical protein
VTVYNFYIDSSAGTGGDGTSGDPWGSIQEAIDEATVGSYSVGIFNCKGSETWSSALDFSSWGGSSGMMLRGMSSTAGDGGRYTIDIDGNSWPNAAKNYWVWCDLNLTNSGSDSGFYNWGAAYSVFWMNCKFSDWNVGSGNAVLSPNEYSARIMNCEFTDIDGDAVGKNSATVDSCFFSNSGTREIETACQAKVLINSVFSLDGASNGWVQEREAYCAHNSFFSNGGTGTGVECEKGRNTVHSCLFAGWSGTGGIGLKLRSYGYEMRAVAYKNSAYNCTTNYDLNDTGLHLLIEDNETLTGSPFAQSGSATDYDNRRTYFSPQDVGNVLGGGIGGNSRGAIQLTSADSGSSVIPARPIQIGA